MLRERRFARDNRLRVAYLDRIRRTPGTSSALIDAGGRVLLALPAAWIPATVTPPDAPGPFELSSGGASACVTPRRSRCSHCTPTA
ncbi:hypothetical protein BH23ACT10_BH23ACT10_13070 [soil metagenome]